MGKRVYLCHVQKAASRNEVTGDERRGPEDGDRIHKSVSRNRKQKTVICGGECELAILC